MFSPFCLPNHSDLKIEEHFFKTAYSYSCMKKCLLFILTYPYCSIDKTGKFALMLSYFSGSIPFTRALYAEILLR